MNIGVCCVMFELVHDPPCNALNPCNGTLVDPVTNCRRRPLLSSLKASTACQNHRTTLLSLVQCLRRVLVFQSVISIFPSPPMISWKRGRKKKETTKMVSLMSLKIKMASLMDVLSCFRFMIGIAYTSSSLWSKALRRC